MKQKGASYVDKNCTLNQEFSFAICRMQLNKIYNFHFTGCQLWDLFSQAAVKFYSTYNRSVKVMADLPYATHRYLREPLSGQQHMSITLIRNILSFINKIKQSAKPVLRQLYNIAKNDVRTITGSNLRNILLQTGLSSVDDQLGTVKQIKYEEIREIDKWRIPIIQEAIDIKCGKINPPDG